MNRCRRILAAALAAVMLLALTACGQSADTNNSAEQTVVRIGTPATGDHGARMLEAARVAAEKQYFEEELAKVGCRPEYVGFDGAGPAVNEAMISGDLDVAIYGDMPALVLASKFSGVTFIAMDPVRSCRASMRWWSSPPVRPTPSCCRAWRPIA